MRHKFLPLLLLPLLLSACGETREVFGLGRVTPDEFAVVDRPPLAIPPDFKLRPPAPGAARPQELTPAQRAAQATFGTAAAAPPAAGAKDNAEKDLLAKAGADKAAPDIRRTVDQEASQRVSTSRHLADDLLWWRKDKADTSATVNADAEAKRVRDNQAKGKPANEGATPIIERRKSGWLGL
ncbi:MAG: DUF3035 domain-containing protein [Alphaproteobacteria bacterium]